MRIGAGVRRRMIRHSPSIAVFDHVAGAHQVQVARDAEGQVVSRRTGRRASDTSCRAPLTKKTRSPASWITLPE